jgi:hypothetical protein
MSAMHGNALLFAKKVLMLVSWLAFYVTIPGYAALASVCHATGVLASSAAG